MTTPQPNQLPEEVKPPYKISEREPVFPCWCFHPVHYFFNRELNQWVRWEFNGWLDKYAPTHWHPDQPTAPTDTPCLAPRPPDPVDAEWAKRAGYEIGVIYSGSNLIAGANADHFAAIITKHAAASSEENTKLRFFLYVNYTGCQGYHDDGELQDTTAFPIIDFKRDPVAEMERKMVERTTAWIKTNPDAINQLRASHPAATNLTEERK